MNAIQIDSERDSQNSAPPPGDAGRSLDARLLRRVLQGIGDPNIEMVLWNGAAVRAGAAHAEPIGRVHVKDRAALFGLLRDTQVHFGDAYSEGRIDIDGDLVALLEAVYRAVARDGDRGVLARMVGRLQSGGRRSRQNTLAGSRDNIHHHYDIGNEFYSLWLGRDDGVHLRLLPDAGRDAGAGAGGQDGPRLPQAAAARRRDAWSRPAAAGATLALHMAQHYGVRVRAFNISREQVAYARERARARGPRAAASSSSRTTTATSAASYDAFVSVGMLEHVGVGRTTRTLGRVIARALQRRTAAASSIRIGRN